MREMKDSGIDWVGEIPKDWYTSKVGRIGEYINGYAFKPTDWGSSGLPIIRIQNLSSSLKQMNYYNGKIDDKYHVKKGDYLISWSATLDVFKWEHETGLLNQHIFKAIPNEEVIGYSYFYWIAKIFIIEMSKNKHGSAMQHVTNGVFNNFKIPLQDLATQQRIADYLDKKCSEIDSIIEKTKSTIEEYKKLKQSIITEAVTKGLDPNVEMKDSGIEWISKVPKHWDLRKIKHILHPQQREVYPTDGIITCFRNGEVTLRNNKKPDGYTLSDTEHGYQGVDIGDLVIHGMDAFAGAIGISDSRGKCTPVVHVCTSKEAKAYYMYLIRALAFNDVLMSLSEGIRIRSSDYRNWNKLSKIVVQLPPKEEQIEIANYLDKKCQEIDLLIEKKQTIVSELESYKKSLIYECVTGKREV